MQVRRLLSRQRSEFEGRDGVEHPVDSDDRNLLSLAHGPEGGTDELLEMRARRRAFGRRVVAQQEPLAALGDHRRAGASGRGGRGGSSGTSTFSCRSSRRTNNNLNETTV